MAGAPVFHHHRAHGVFFTFHYHTSLRCALVLIDQSAYFKQIALIKQIERLLRKQAGCRGQ